MAEAYMRTSGTAIREMPIGERTPPQTVRVAGRAVAKGEGTSRLRQWANSFFVVPSMLLGSDVQIGDRLSLRVYQGPCAVALGIATHLRVVLGAQLDELREDKRGWPRLLLQRQARANFVGRFSF
jgi:hypothetical protein